MDLLVVVAGPEPHGPGVIKKRNHARRSGHLTRGLVAKPSQATPLGRAGLENIVFQLTRTAACSGWCGAETSSHHMRSRTSGSGAGADAGAAPGMRAYASVSSCVTCRQLMNGEQHFALASTVFHFHELGQVEKSFCSFFLFSVAASFTACNSWRGPGCAVQVSESGCHSFLLNSDQAVRFRSETKQNTRLKACVWCGLHTRGPPGHRARRQ
jgi:hypothetical protein